MNVHGRRYDAYLGIHQEAVTYDLATLISSAHRLTPQDEPPADMAGHIELTHTPHR